MSATFDARRGCYLFALTEGPARLFVKRFSVLITLLEINMETQKGAYNDYSPFKRGYLSFHVSLGECIRPLESWLLLLDGVML